MQLKSVSLQDAEAWLKARKIYALTYAQYDEQDDEGIKHWEKRGGDRRDHFCQHADSAKEPDHPESPHQSDQP